MVYQRDIIAVWIAREILPHEHHVRKALHGRWRGAVDVEEVMQEAYCRIAKLPSVENITNPVGYFFRTAHSIAVDILRRDGIINFTTMTENEWSNVIDDGPLADQVVEGRQELERMRHLLSKLTDTCRRAIELRRLDGVSQKEVAQQLGVSESVVRNHLVRGVRKIMDAMSAQDEDMNEDVDTAMEQEVVRIDKFRSY